MPEHLEFVNFFLPSCSTFSPAAEGVPILCRIVRDKSSSDNPTYILKLEKHVRGGGLTMVSQTEKRRTTLPCSTSLFACRRLIRFSFLCLPT